ncbi:MAG: Asp-tRNA(Asn)/Glu-tRNA(Gln) amidotransferase subunit GatA [Thermomicrobiales bacterium]|nr:Asp-tRNA(Asn)/Glu-tRNA(Gln) amidotransferase subunit GatA [Thermomicrobiales bacterium]MCO5223159.1 Asp-tRNA(Asn)/Glu-tRNA(Gln) amidotransferase subunit GatA [Thermomicrobiales bacterium]
MSVGSELTGLTIAQARDLLDAKEFSAVELTQAHLERIERLEPALKCHIEITPDVALAQATAADRAIGDGDQSPLTGIPTSLKDVLCTVDSHTTAGSQILKGYRSAYDATVVSKLRSAGAVFVGKGNTDEFAMGSSTENSSFFPTHNPWDIDRVPGGSSGGPAAAVAAAEAMFGLGSDTGGSIRQPAGFCGVVGLKPTYGRVSRFGLIAFASSLDQIGPFTRTVEDAAIVLEAIAGHDSKDSTSSPRDVPSFRGSLRTDLKGVRIGVAEEYSVSGMEAGVETAVANAIEQLALLGAEIVPVSLPHTRYALSTYYITAPAEASANLARFDGVRFGHSVDAPTIKEMYERTRGEGFGSEVKRRIMLGTYALSSGYYDAYYVKAQKVRTLIKQDFDRAFEQVDVIVAPTSPTTAFRIGDRIDDPYQMYLADVFTIPANMAGIPGISVPGGFSNDMPVGLQFLGQSFDEATLLAVAHAYEQSQPWVTMTPALQ